MEMNNLYGMDYPVFVLDEDKSLARLYHVMSKNFGGKNGLACQQAKIIIDLGRRQVEAINARIDDIVDDDTGAVYRGNRERIVEASCRTNARPAIATMRQHRNRYSEAMSRGCKPDPKVDKAGVLVLEDLFEAGVLQVSKKKPGANSEDLARTIFKLPKELAERFGMSHSDPKIRAAAFPKQAKKIQEAAAMIKIIDRIIENLEAIATFSYKNQEVAA